jgi:hypothetical protein
MLTMNIDNKLDKLKSIRQVEAPPFLFIRIQQGIQNLADVPAPIKWRVAFVTAAIVLIVLNTGILLKSSSQSKATGVEQVVNSLQLSSSNDFYHD